MADVTAPTTTSETTTVVTQTQQVSAPVQDTPGPDPTEVRSSWFWIKDTRGYGSVTVTLLFVSFWVTTLSYIASMFEKLGPFTIREFNPAVASSYMIPIISLYFSRRWTDAKFGVQKND